MSSNQTPSTPSSSACEDPISLAVGVAVEGSLATPIASQKADAVYRLKSVTYSAQSDGTFFASEKNRCQILLQNENGPCPLIAAMNVLLLRGSLTLPPAVVRSGAVSAEEVISLLATYSIERMERMGQSDFFQVGEFMDVLPLMQFGMDVNPRFTCKNGSKGATSSSKLSRTESGPRSYVEFTTGVAAFDAFGVEIVHGWVIDPQDSATIDLVGNKSYNELVLEAVKGSEARTESERLTREIDEICKKLEESKQENIDLQTPKPEFQDFLDIPNPGTNAPDTKINKDDNDDELRSRRDGLRKKQREAQECASRGSLIQNFLDETGHQLTYYGLANLHEIVSENQFCVFFRNNHFSTIVKRNGQLYLLVTDFGYANVEEVVWETLNEVDGNTDYVDSGFFKSVPRGNILPASPTLSAEALHSQRGQNERDYQLAKNLQEGKSIANININEQEARLVAAAEQVSLKDWNNTNSITVGVHTAKPCSPPESSDPGNNVSVSAFGPLDTKVIPKRKDNGTNEEQKLSGNSIRDQSADCDRDIALALQAQYENEGQASVGNDEALARMLAANERTQNDEFLARRIAAMPNRLEPANRNTQRKAPSGECTIS
mmetsp:Transcript_17764/g.35470  ORF Transcript_17764/g.35470 Transcript_17764/m.35470 type:complete len:605 (-) Transcript_17764:248-2062(-)